MDELIQANAEDIKTQVESIFNGAAERVWVNIRPEEGGPAVVQIEVYGLDVKIAKNEQATVVFPK